MPGTRTWPYVTDQVAMETGQTTWNRGALIARSSVDPQAGRLSTANADEILGVYYGANPANAASVFSPDTLPVVALWGTGIPILVQASATITLYDYLTPSSVTPGTVRTALPGEPRVGRAMTGVTVGGATNLVMAELYAQPGASLTAGLAAWPQIVLGAEAANVILATITVANAAGVAIADEFDIEAHLVSAAGIDSLAAAFTLTDGGSGAVISTTANARLLYRTATTGIAQINVTDVAGGSGATVYLMVTVFGNAGTARFVGQKNFIAVTFD